MASHWRQPLKSPHSPPKRAKGKEENQLGSKKEKAAGGTAEWRSRWRRTDPASARPLSNKLLCARLPSRRAGGWGWLTTVVKEEVFAPRLLTLIRGKIKHDIVIEAVIGSGKQPRWGPEKRQLVPNRARRKRTMYPIFVHIILVTL